MSDSLVTQCPACQTRFKLSRSQLDAANGAVRCGACLEVFAGADCLIEQPGKSQFFPAGAEEPTKAAWTASREAPDLQDNGSAVDPTPPASGDNEPAQLQSDQEIGFQPSIHSGDEDSFTDWYQGTEIIYSFADEEDGDPISTGSGDSTVDAAESVQDLDDLSLQSLNESIDAISLAMVEAPGNKRRLRYYLTYSLLNLLLICVLWGQYLWFNRSELAAREDLRGYYVKVCQVLEPRISCNLPDYVNLGQISTRKLIVRSHPAIRNALIIDAIILNSADFSQPFPRLELKFTDLDFKTVASRRFEAKEYLGGELTGMKYIPARTEVRVSLEIVDPGNLAVSYELYAVHP